MPEVSQISPENSIPSPDLLIVLGKNIGVGSSPDDIRHDKYHLSRESRLNVLAAGSLYRPGMKILFSTGETAGEGVPAESDAMRSYLMSRFPEIPEEDIELEDNSIDTAGNAEEVASQLEENGEMPENIGLLTVGYHVPAAEKLFKRYGVPVTQTFSAEEVLKNRGQSFKQYAEAWEQTDRIKNEYKKEKFRNWLLHIDRKGKLLRLITQRSRK
jgi:uncharacterized SAM-binding protein YcdF (DUF218 family)